MAQKTKADLEKELKEKDDRIAELEAQPLSSPAPVSNPVDEGDPDDPVCMYSKAHPEGKIFKRSEVGKLDKAWVDNPSKLD